MKKITLFLCAFLVSGISSFAQQITPINLQPKSAWQIHQVDASLGANWDVFNDLSIDGLMDIAKNREEIQRDVSGMEEEVMAFTAALGLYTGVSLRPLNRATNEYRDNQELRLGLTFYTPREVMIEYKDQANNESLTYCALHGEISAEAAYIFKGELLRYFDWTIGLGSSASISYGDEFLLIPGQYYDAMSAPPAEGQTETYAANSIYYLRGFVPYSLYANVFDGLSIGVEGRAGIGVQQISTGKSNYMNNTGALLFGVRYKFR